MDKNTLKELSKKCPFRLGDYVTTIDDMQPKMMYPGSKKIADIEILQCENTGKTTFVYKFEDSRKYYRLKRVVTDRGITALKKVKVPINKIKMWPYLPEHLG